MRIYAVTDRDGKATSINVSRRKMICKARKQMARGATGVAVVETRVRFRQYEKPEVSKRITRVFGTVTPPQKQAA